MCTEKLEMLAELEHLYAEGFPRRKRLTAESKVEEIKFELELLKYQRRQAVTRKLEVDLWAKCFLSLVVCHIAIAPSDGEPEK